MSANALVSFAQISNNYERIYCDIWGVVHNGVIKNVDAETALSSYRAQGGQVALVTNAPRPTDHIQAMLDQLDVNPSAYDCIVTSGDVTQDLLKPYRGKVIHHVGPDHDRNLFVGTGVLFGTAQEAEVLVVSDMDEKGEDVSIYDERLELWKGLGLKMICGNPDKFVEIGGSIVYCGGALADIYQDAGGEVEMAGKPFAPIYEGADLRLSALGLADVSKQKTVAIGDAARTDAKGAAGQGVDFLFITGSIHAQELHTAEQGTLNTPANAAQVAELIRPSGANLAGYMRELI